ncbi:unnamed protein product [Durusdinium trenchii]|uniref:Uncharacterized protein n=1 Tax=Durusdinium trenchii TaxID=1381693 RepID=A0ABP0NHS7_9DINO
MSERKDVSSLLPSQFTRRQLSNGMLPGASGRVCKNPLRAAPTQQRRLTWLYKAAANANGIVAAELQLNAKAVVYFGAVPSFTASERSQVATARWLDHVGLLKETPKPKDCW